MIALCLVNSFLLGQDNYALHKNCVAKFTKIRYKYFHDYKGHNSFHELMTLRKK